MSLRRAVSAGAVSLVLHAVPFGHALAQRIAKGSTSLPDVEAPTPASVWAGETFDIDTLPPSEPAAPSEPATGAPAAEPEPAAPSEPATSAPAAEPEPAAPSEPATSAPAPDPEPAAPPRAALTRPSSAARPSAPQASSAAGAAVDAGTDAAADAASPPKLSGGTTYGQADARAAVAPLGKGLLRVLPRVSFVEPRFRELPIGAAAGLRFSVELDATGHPVPPVEIDARDARIPWLEALLARALLLLRGGAFSLPEGTSGPHRCHFELDYEIVQGEPAAGDWLEPGDLAEIGRLIEPTLQTPGRAHFRYNSGREVRLVLRLVER